MAHGNSLALTNPGTLHSRVLAGGRRGTFICTGGWVVDAFFFFFFFSSYRKYRLSFFIKEDEHGGLTAWPTDREMAV